MIVGIHQPNFFPWIGYFFKIVKSDKFVFLDNVQFPKKGGSYINRTEIIMGAKSNWLTVPIYRFHGTWNINQCVFSEPKWRKRIASSLLVNYIKAPFYNSTNEFIFNLIEFDTDNLADFNINVIKNICEKLQINCEFHKSSDFDIETEDATLRLIEIVRHLKGDTYISGKGGQKYQDDQLFEKNKIKLIYNDFIHPKYHNHMAQQTEIGLSIIDLIFSIGFEELIKIIHND
jgi:WbqC-like protein family.